MYQVPDKKIDKTDYSFMRFTIIQIYGNILYEKSIFWVDVIILL